MRPGCGENSTLIMGGGDGRVVLSPRPSAFRRGIRVSLQPAEITAGISPNSHEIMRRQRHLRNSEVRSETLLTACSFRGIAGRPGRSSSYPSVVAGAGATRPASAAIFVGALRMGIGRSVALTMNGLGWESDRLAVGVAGMITGVRRCAHGGARPGPAGCRRLLGALALLCWSRGGDAVVSVMGTFVRILAPSQDGVRNPSMSRRGNHGSRGPLVQ